MIKAHILRVQQTPKLRTWWIWPDTAIDITQIIKTKPQSKTSLKETLMFFNEKFCSIKEKRYNFVKRSGVASLTEASKAFTDIILKNKREGIEYES
jgi:hypothetical protein